MGDWAKKRNWSIFDQSRYRQRKLVSFLGGSNTCKNNIDISLKPSVDSMWTAKHPQRWKERVFRSQNHLVTTLGTFHLPSFPFLFVIDHNNNKSSRKGGQTDRVCVKKHLVNFCVSAMPPVNFSLNSDDKMSSFKCLLPIWPKAHVHSFSFCYPLFIDSTLL